MTIEKIHIDVLTLDSVQCAACGYMMESIAAMPGEIQDLIEYREWSIKTKEGIARFKEPQKRPLTSINLGRFSSSSHLNSIIATPCHTFEDRSRQAASSASAGGRILSQRTLTPPEGGFSLIL